MRTATYTHHACTVHEHRFTVPLDHNSPSEKEGETLEIFAREIIAPQGDHRPYLVFMQGGPGSRGPRPAIFTEGFIGRALKDYRVLLLDQRGTGQSHRLDAQSLADFSDDEARADYLMLFRQDQIVRDAEIIRKELADGQPWTILGQSYGGFISLCYLSIAPEGLSSVLITGGLPGLVPIDDIYRLTYKRTAARNKVYFQRYPMDEFTIREVAAHLRDTEEILPTGERLTPSRFRMIGMGLGTATRTDLLHYLLEGPWVHIRGQRRLSREFLEGIASEITIAPMYGVLHESIYAGATTDLAGKATNWSAERLSHDILGFYPDADPLDWSIPYYLTAEHMMRSFFQEDPALIPLAGAADTLAHRTTWPAIYDTDALKNNTVPVSALVYYDDIFVPRELSLETAHLIGARTWITNEYQHDGLRASGADALNHLLELQRD